MEKEQFYQSTKEYIHLLSLYLNNKEDDSFIVDEHLLSFFIKLSKHHSLMAMLYQALYKTKVKVDPETLKKLEPYYLNNLRKVVLFEKERKDLYQYLNDNNIDYLPLKGIVINNYYQDKNIREFADNDILFSNGDNLIKDFFVKCGYQVKAYRKGCHDVYLKKPFFNYEMHRALFIKNEDYPSYVKYFKNYMDRTVEKDGHEKMLKNEDFYIYFTAHTYKHYQGSGCGIRTLVDYYLYLRKEQLDFDYINKELEKLNLLEFSNNIRSLSKKIFDEEPLNEVEEEMLLFITSSGTYGTLEHSVSKGVKQKGRFGYYMARVFPPYHFYKLAYPWAYYCPILIPFAWLARFFRILFKNPKKAKKELKMIREHKEEQ